VDNGKGESYTQQYKTDPFEGVANHEEREPYSRNKGSSRGDQFIERSNQNLLSSKEEFQFAAGSRDIFDDTVSNDGGSDNGGFSGPIKYGVNRPQSDGRVHGRKAQWPADRS
jgi:hypothetical protein